MAAGAIGAVVVMACFEPGRRGHRVAQHLGPRGDGLGLLGLGIAVRTASEEIGGEVPEEETAEYPDRPPGEEAGDQSTAGGLGEAGGQIRWPTADRSWRPGRPSHRWSQSPYHQSRPTPTPGPAEQHQGGHR